jgi:hypothetical protein
VEPDSGGDVVARLRWLTGCWVEQRANGTTISEQWNAADGALRGTSRTRRDNRIVESEVMRITQQGDDVVFHAEPSGQQPADFRAITISDTLVAFENPTHDFPQRISYHRVGADSLHARVEGTTSRGPRQIDFRMAQAQTCE